MDKVTQVKTQFRLEQWKKLISECQNSGLPVRTWCAQNGLKEQSYYYYLKKLREQAIENLPVPIQEECIFREICASVPIERSAIPLETEHCSVKLISY